MKWKNLLLLSIGCLISFSSCKKEDVDLIIGKWKYSAIDFSIQTENPATTESLNSTMEMTKQFINDITITFNDNNIYELTVSILGGYSNSDTGEYSLKNGKLLLNGKEVKYDLSKKKLSITITGEQFFGEERYQEFIKDMSIIQFDISLKMDKK